MRSGAPQQMPQSRRAAAKASSATGSARLALVLDPSSLVDSPDESTFRCQAKLERVEIIDPQMAPKREKGAEQSWEPQTENGRNAAILNLDPDGPCALVISTLELQIAVIIK